MKNTLAYDSFIHLRERVICPADKSAVAETESKSGMVSGI